MKDKCGLHDECFKRVEGSLEQQSDDIRKIFEITETISKDVTSLKVRMAYFCGAVTVIAFIIPLIFKFF